MELAGSKQDVQIVAVVLPWPIPVGGIVGIIAPYLKETGPEPKARAGSAIFSGMDREPPREHFSSGMMSKG
jgi:hypothetical protein